MPPVTYTLLALGVGDRSTQGGQRIQAYQVYNQAIRISIIGHIRLVRSTLNETPLLHITTGRMCMHVCRLRRAAVA